MIENKLSQDFTTIAYNQVWVSDITYIRTAEGWLYLTSVIDLFDRKVIGWQVSRSIKTHQSLIFHSDRGIQYACNLFKETVRECKWIEQAKALKELDFNYKICRCGGYLICICENELPTVSLALDYYKYKTYSEASSALLTAVLNYLKEQKA